MSANSANTRTRQKASKARSGRVLADERAHAHLLLCSVKWKILKRTQAPLVKEAVLGNNATPANVELRSDHLGRLIGALGNRGPEPAAVVAGVGRFQGWE